MEKKPKKFSVMKAAESPKPKKLDDPDGLEARHPKLYEATLRVAEGGFSTTVAREYGIPIDKFKKFLQRNGIIAARLKNPYQIIAEIHSYIDIKEVVEKASPDKVLEMLGKDNDKLIAASGGISHRSEVSLTGAIDKKMSKIPIEELERYVDAEIVEEEEDEDS